jgi:hypothetical protein
LWFADPRTLIVALSTEDMQAIPMRPVSNGEQLSGALKSLIGSRMTVGTQAWIAGHVENSKTGIWYACWPASAYRRRRVRR